MSKLAKFAIGKVVSSAIGGGLGGGLAGFAAGELAGGAFGSSGKESVMLPGGGEGQYTIDRKDGRGPQVIDTSAYRIKGDKGVYDILPLLHQGPSELQTSLAKAQGKVAPMDSDARIKAALKDDPTALANYLKAYPDAAPPPKNIMNWSRGGRIVPEVDKFGYTIQKTGIGAGATSFGDGLREAAKNINDRKNRGMLDMDTQRMLAEYAATSKSPVLLGASTTSNSANDQLRKTVGLKTVLGG